MIDHPLFNKMFKEWYEQFVYFAYYFVCDVEVCKDIVNDAFEYLWRNQERIEEETAKTYMYSIIRSRCIDHLRRQNSHDEYVEFTLKLTREMLKEGNGEPDERILQIRRAMKNLPPTTCHILEQCYIHNKSYKEVAEELNLSVAAIHKHIVKALRILRENFRDEGNRNAF